MLIGGGPQRRRLSFYRGLPQLALTPADC